MKAVRRCFSSTNQERWSIPIFLCPPLGGGPLPVPPSRAKLNKLKNGTSRRQRSSLQALKAPRIESAVADTSLTSTLPRTCPGCGAYTQNFDPGDAGFYSTTRKPVKAFLKAKQSTVRSKSIEEAQTFSKVIANASPSTLQSLGFDDASELEESFTETPADTPVCDRCHQLLHHHKGVSIIHPTLQSIQETILESPYKYNHIYHILDAADFPLSLIPQLQQHLSLLPQRSQNRRVKLGKFYHGRKAEMSFIITRSDLLAPKKEQVDSLMPYLIQVLRDSLGSPGKDIRLGNVRCVSSKRGWWTKELKEDIWRRGGGGWMVGKVNVGKSNLFESVFPKGRNEAISFQALRSSASKEDGAEEASFALQDSNLQDGPVLHSPGTLDSEDGSESKLLPPAPVERAFPVMPVVSSLPGTTASPIRLPFGSGRGELIDLPGLSRGNLEDHVREEHKPDLVMRQRLKPEQLSVKPGQSLLIGGLIRITPTFTDTVLLACPFVPLHCHVTSTEKAAAIHTQHLSSGIPNITLSEAGDKMLSAGIFSLAWDVTKHRAGPLTAPAGVGLKPHVLPFVIYSTDILVEGCGWIELAVQVRKRALESADGSEAGGADGKTRFPTVEVFSPNGKHVGSRRPMNAWMVGGSRPVPTSRRKSRPRRSMKGVKKSLKLARRLLE